MKIILSVTTITLLIMVAACKSNTKPKTPDEILEQISKSGTINVGKTNFTVAKPKGWTTKDTTMNNIAFFVLMAPRTDDNFNTNINIINESMQKLSFDDYKTNTIKSMKEYVPSIELVDKGDIEAGDLKGSWFSYKMDQSGLKINAINYTFPKDGIAYIITAVTKDGELGNYRNTFDGVAKSFALKGE